MVVIRLSRSGSKARPFFNIVAADKRVRRDGAFIERLGFYNPNARGAEEGLRLALDESAAPTAAPANAAAARVASAPPRLNARVRDARWAAEKLLHPH